MMVPFGDLPRGAVFNFKGKTFIKLDDKQGPQMWMMWPELELGGWYFHPTVDHLENMKLFIGTNGPILSATDPA